MQDYSTIALLIVPLLFGIIFHEVSHGWVAEKLGDPTARMMGRITLNPISHIDPIGTIVLPGILLLTGSHVLFGWAKPVPVNFANLRGGRRDMALVAFSGPLSNLVLALLSSVIFHLTFSGPTGAGPVSDSIIVPVHLMAGQSIWINLVLMLVNLIPILPLDGGRIVVGLAPEQIAIPMARMERYGMLIVLLLIASGILSYVVSPVLKLFYRMLL
jgi:Zn-dependent protease